jgi:hypothetical protein
MEGMARGFESKSVESQQADRDALKADSAVESVDPAIAAARRTIQLARARAVLDLNAASRPAHRAMLEQAIAALDAQLARLEPS